MANSSEGHADSTALLRTTGQTTSERATPNFAYGPGAPVAGNPVLFEAEASEDDREYEWSFGDGASATGEKATAFYDAGGNWTVTLSVTDDEGATETAERSLTVYSEVTLEIGEVYDGLVPVTIRASAFDPADLLTVESLRFGAPTAVAMGGGAAPAESEECDGDLRIWVPADESGISGDAPYRLAGRTTDDVPVAGTVE